MDSILSERVGNWKLPSRISHRLCQWRRTVAASDGRLRPSWTHQHCSHQQLAELCHHHAENCVSRHGRNAQVQDLCFHSWMQSELVPSGKGESWRPAAYFSGRCYADDTNFQCELCTMRQRSVRGRRRLLHLQVRLFRKGDYGRKQILLLRKPTHYWILGG